MYRQQVKTGARARLSSFTFASHSVAHELHPQRNEDTLLVDRRRGLAGVFDGVGGSSEGAVASQLGARIIRREWKRMLAANGADLLLLNDGLNVQSLLYQLVEQAQAAISDEGERRASGQEEYRYPSTTMVVAAFCRQAGESGYVLGYAHVGDSRVYLLRQGEPLQRLTVDDGYFLLKLEDSTINEEDALRIDQATDADQLSAVERAIFEKRNGITQSLGHFNNKKTSLIIHTDQTLIYPGDRVLLCSDGIHDNLTDAEIEATLQRKPRTPLARDLVRQALKRSHEEAFRSKQDDMSAVVVTCNV